MNYKGIGAYIAIRSKLQNKALFFTSTSTLWNNFSKIMSNSSSQAGGENNKEANLTWKTAIDDKGAFKRKPSVFRNFVTADGSSGFKAEANRYHLYVSLACPWAHRVLIVRSLKGLEQVLPYTVVDWFLDERGWVFNDEVPKCTKDTVNNCSRLRQVYELASKDYDGRVTVPVLWDKQKQTIVNNESAELIEMLNSEFNEFCSTAEQKKLDLYPKHLRGAIDEINSWVYTQINNGVYKSGFATKQEAYNEAVTELFHGLDKVEEILATNRYLTGDHLTLADIRLFTTLIRFDKVYVGHFKCNKKRIMDYPNIWGYTRELYQHPAIKPTVDFEHIEKHYHVSHTSINPHSIVPIGPQLDFDAQHGRDHLPKSPQSN